MKLKTYTALSMAEALEIARNELGDEALIVSSERDGLGGGIRITVAIEEQGVSEREIEQALFGEISDKTSDEIKEILDYHGLPSVLSERIIITAGKSQSLDVQEALSYSINEVLRFDDAKSIKEKIIMVVGTAGAGKSSMVAKLATEAKLKGLVPGIITTDTYRAGANDTLKAFADILGAEMIPVKNPDEFIDAVKKVSENCDRIFIDTQAINPYNDKDLIAMNQYVTMLPNIEPVLVYEAGKNTEETIEHFCIFAENGVSNASITKIDIAKRMGGIVAGAYNSNINIRDFSTKQNIPNSLKPASAEFITQLLLPIDFFSKE